MYQVSSAFVQWDHGIKSFCYYCLPPDNERLSCGRHCLGHHCCSSMYDCYCLFWFAKEVDLKNQTSEENSVKKTQQTCSPRETTDQLPTKASVSSKSVTNRVEHSSDPFILVSPQTKAYCRLIT